jgi:hypothetical protein
VPPNSPSSGIPPPGVFPSPPPSLFSSAEGARVVFGMRIGTTAHRAPGLSTSGSHFFGANERYLNGIGRKSACSVGCSVELGDLVRIRRNGLSRIIIPNHETLPRDNCKSAASRGATTSARLMPGRHGYRWCLNVAPCRSQLVWTGHLHRLGEPVSGKGRHLEPVVDAALILPGGEHAGPS